MQKQKQGIPGSSEAKKDKFGSKETNVDMTTDAEDSAAALLAKIRERQEAEEREAIAKRNRKREPRGCWC